MTSPLSHFVFESMEVREDPCLWDLLLLADPSRDMVLKYLDKSRILVIKKEHRLVGEAVFSRKNEETWELHNMAVTPELQGIGLGRCLLEEVERCCSQSGGTLIVGTAVIKPGEKTFYEKCGYSYSHVIPGFFTEHYNPPPIEEGIECKDMTYFAKPLNRK